MALLVQTHERSARWDKENNCWDIGDRVLYHWTTIKHQTISDRFDDISKALEFIIEYDSKTTYLSQ